MVSGDSVPLHSIPEKKPIKHLPGSYWKANIRLRPGTNPRLRAVSAQRAPFCNPPLWGDPAYIL